MRLRAALVLAAVFLVGAIGGGAAVTLLITRRIAAVFEGSPKRTMAKVYAFELDRKVGLTRQQREEVERVVYDDHAAIARELQRIEPELSALRKARHQRILALLSLEQRAVAEKLDEKFERRHREEIDLEK
jgi:hypothetical protein